MSPWVLLAVVLGCVVCGEALFITLGVLALLCWNLFANDWSGLGDALDNTTSLILSFEGLEKDLIIAIPLFTLAGAIMTHGGISEKLIRFMRAVIGWLPGGLGIACILACCFFAAISGSSAVTIIAVGGMLYPALRKAGYSQRFTLGLLTACGAIGTLVVPALPLVAYSVFASNAAGELVPAVDLYYAGIGPTVLAVGVFTIYCMLTAIVRKIPRDKFSIKELVLALVHGFFAVLMPFLLVYLLFEGIATIVETSAVAVLYALLVECVIYREVKLKQLGRIFVDTTRLVGSILVIMAMALSVSEFLTDQQVPMKATDMMRYDRVAVDDPSFGEVVKTGEVVYRGEERLVLIERDDIAIWKRAFEAAKALGLPAESLGDLVAMHRGAPLAEEATWDSAFTEDKLAELRDGAKLTEAEAKAHRAAMAALEEHAVLGEDLVAEVSGLEKIDAGERVAVRKLSRDRGLSDRDYPRLLGLLERGDQVGLSSAQAGRIGEALAARAVAALETRAPLSVGRTGTVYELTALLRYRDAASGLTPEVTEALTTLARQRDAFEGQLRSLAELEELEWHDIAPKDVLWTSDPKVKTKLGFLLGVNLILLAVGCIMDIFSAIIVMAPLLVPMARAYDVNLVHLGIVFAMNLEIGFATPPFGLNLFISQSFFRKSLAEVFGATLPFLLMLLAVLGVVTYWEPLSLWLVPAGG